MGALAKAGSSGRHSLGRGIRDGVRAPARHAVREPAADHGSVPASGSAPGGVVEPRIARSAGAVSAAVALSRLTGLAREMIMARLLGAGAVYDAFLLGFRIPNLARDLFAEGALSSAFVPAFSRCLASRGRRDANELGQRLGTALFLAVTVFC